MAESHTAAGLPQYFRAGWKGAANIVFKYLIESTVLSRTAGKATAKWVAKVGDIVIGGQPVTEYVIAEQDFQHEVRRKPR